MPAAPTPAPVAQRGAVPPIRPGGTRRYQRQGPAPLGSSDPTPVPLAARTPTDQYDDASQISVLTALLALPRGDERAFRLAAGRLVLEGFFLGRFSEYTDADPRKAAPFLRFVERHRLALDKAGLTSAALRAAVRTFQGWRTLPEVLREGLQADHLLELSRVRDPSQRTQLAEAALRQTWPLARLRDAVDAVAAQSAGATSSDGMQTRIGMEGSDAGRVIARLEHAIHELQTTLAVAKELDPRALSAGQRQRLMAALAMLK